MRSVTVQRYTFGKHSRPGDRDSNNHRALRRALVADRLSLQTDEVDSSIGNNARASVCACSVRPLSAAVERRPRLHAADVVCGMRNHRSDE